MNTASTSITEQYITTCLDILNKINSNIELVEEQLPLKSILKQVTKKIVKVKKQKEKDQKKREDRMILEHTILAQREPFDDLKIVKNRPSKNALPATYQSKELNHAIPCYVCKKKYQRVHFFYSKLCP